MYPTHSIALLSMLLASFCFMQTEAFLAPVSSRCRSSKLHVGNIFGGLFGQGEKQSGGQEEQQSSGPKTVIDLSANTVKAGPLKFFLQIYLVGLQNQPVKGAWILQKNDEDGSLDMYYKDATGKFNLSFNENSIKVQRYGSRPSLEYMLQESVMLHGVLDELTQIAFEVDDIEEEKRLLQFGDDKDAINKARESLPARKA
jgi:hypothetical protein